MFVFGLDLWYNIMYTSLPVTGAAGVTSTRPPRKKEKGGYIMALINALKAVPLVILILCVGLYKNLGKK